MDTDFYDALETRSADQRAADISQHLPQLIADAKAHAAGYAAHFADIDPSAITSAQALASLPVLRKSDLAKHQASTPPLGGFSTSAPAYLFQSPGPIYEPGFKHHDWWGLGRFLHAAGIRAGDVVQNCFSYHFTPAGHMFDNAAAAVGATVFPAGTGQTELQAQAAAHLGVTAYAGTPDYLKTILESGDAQGLDLSKITRAVVGGGPFFPAIKDYYADRGILGLQCYATADVGNIAYESTAAEGLIVDEGVIVEIVTPGTGTPVPDGEIGEVLVTRLAKDYPLIRFATGDLSAVMQGDSPCGRTNMRIVGWRGRADQAAKVKGMFVRPEQVAALVASTADVDRARVTITRDGDTDAMSVALETTRTDTHALEAAVKSALKLRGLVECVAPGSLPKDGVVIEDKRPVG